MGWQGKMMQEEVMDLGGLNGISSCGQGERGPQSLGVLLSVKGAYAHPTLRGLATL